MSDVVDDGLVEDLTLRAEAAEARVAELEAERDRLAAVVEAVQDVAATIDQCDGTLDAWWVTDQLDASLAAAPEPVDPIIADVADTEALMANYGQEVR